MVEGSLRTAEMTTPRVGCRKHTSQSALDPKQHKKEQMHGPANNLNIARCVHGSGTLWACSMSPIIFAYLVPSAGLGILHNFLRLAGGTIYAETRGNK